MDATLGVMKVLFREIRHGDATAVAARLDANPALVDAIAKAPPAKDDGQSTLQVAIEAGRLRWLTCFSTGARTWTS